MATSPVGEWRRWTPTGQGCPLRLGQSSGSRPLAAVLVFKWVLIVCCRLKSVCSVPRFAWLLHHFLIPYQSAPRWCTGSCERGALFLCSSSVLCFAWISAVPTARLLYLFFGITALQDCSVQLQMTCCTPTAHTKPQTPVNVQAWMQHYNKPLQALIPKQR